MINISNKKIIYISCSVLIALVCIYLLLIWQIKQIVNDEIIRKIEEIDRVKLKNKKKKILYLKNKINKSARNYSNQNDNQTRSINSDQISDDIDMDIDSYVDPAEGYVRREENNDSNVSIPNMGYSNSRLNKNDIMARDIADGVR